MFRKSNSQRKGIQRGVERRAVFGAKNKTRDSSSKLSRVIAYWMEKLVIMAYNMVMRTAMALHLVPFTQTPEGLYVVKCKKGLAAYKVYRFLTGLVMLYRARVALKVSFQDEFTPANMLAMIEGLAYFDAWIVSIYDASDTVILLNNLDKILSYLKNEQGREFRMFGQLGLSMKILSTINMVPLIILTVAVGNGMLYGGLPTSFVYLTNDFIDMSSMDRIWWQLLFLPLEIICIFSVLMTDCAVNFCSYPAMHLSKVFGEEIRSIKVVDLASREKVERMYICWDLCEKMARPWYKQHLPPLIVSAGCAAVIHIVVAIKYTNIPILLYSVETVMGPAFVCLMGVFLNDAVNVSQLSQGVLAEELAAFRPPGLVGMGLEYQRKLMKRTKALRPISIPMGSFTGVQYSVMVAVWEEILNQVFFLLTL